MSQALYYFVLRQWGKHGWGQALALKAQGSANVACHPLSPSSCSDFSAFPTLGTGELERPWAGFGFLEGKVEWGIRAVR